MASHGYTELEKQLVEAGNKLLQLPSSVDDILSLLDQVENYLSRVEQSPSKSMQTALSPSMKALVADELLRHRDADVKVAVASCISEITRITAPDAPYDDDRMKDIFQLIVSSFENLSDKSSRSYDKRTMILETVAKVRSCVVMLDLECDGLIVEMFQHFLKAIRDDHPDNVFSSMETIMTLVLEESEDISLELISPILASVKSDNQEVPLIARKLAERVVENSAVKLKPYLIQGTKSLGLSLDDYSKVISSICGGTTGAVGHDDRNACGEQSTEESNLARASSDVAAQDENKLAVAYPDEDHLTKESVPETCPEGDHPTEERSPKSVMSNGVAETGYVDRMVDQESTKEQGQEQSHQTDQSVDTNVTSNGEPVDSNSGKILESDPKTEETSKKRGRKPKSEINSTEPDSSRVDSDKEVETTAQNERSISKEVHSSPSAQPFVEVPLPPENEKDNIQMSLPKESGSEAIDVTSPSSSGNVPVESRPKKAGRAKKDNLIREVAPPADLSKASDDTFVSEGKPQRRAGKKATAGHTNEEKTSALADKSKSEGGTTSDSENKPLKLCVKKLDARDNIEDESSLKNKEDAKKRRRGKAVVKTNLIKSSTKDDGKETVPSPKPTLNLVKVEGHLGDIPKTSSKRKRTPAKDKEIVSSTKPALNIAKVEGDLEDTPKLSSKRKGPPMEEKASDEIEYGDNLVGSNIKVWWPDDNKFYNGRIVSFTSVGKKHKVVYDDGEIEFLELREEKWEFRRADSMSDAEKEPECRSSSEMQKKKRAKTNSEPSAKQGKMKGSRGGEASSSKSKGAATKSRSKSRVDGSSKPGDRTEDTSGGKSQDRSKINRRVSIADDSTDVKSKADGGTPKTGSKSKLGTQKTDMKDTPKASMPKTASMSKGKVAKGGSKSKSKNSGNMKEIDGEEEESLETVKTPVISIASKSDNKSKAKSSGKVKETDDEEKESPETVKTLISSKAAKSGNKSKAKSSGKVKEIDGEEEESPETVKTLISSIAAKNDKKSKAKSSGKVKDTEDEEEGSPETVKTPVSSKAPKSGNKSKAKTSGKVKETDGEEEESPETVKTLISSKATKSGKSKANTSLKVKETDAKDEDSPEMVKTPVSAEGMSSKAKKPGAKSVKKRRRGGAAKRS